MEIKQLHKGHLQNMEHLNFAEHVLIMNKEANIDKIKPLLPPLEKAIKDEEEALNQPTKLEGTRELIALDEERDRAYRAMQFMLNSKLLDADKDTAKAAQDIQDVLDRYPGLAAANYTKESSLIDNLVADLKTPDAMAAMGLTGLTAAMGRLEQANLAFATEFRARYKKVIPVGTFNIKALRTAVDKALNAVVRRMESLADLEPETPKLAALITEYNAVIDGRKFMLAQRKGTNKSAHERDMDKYAALLEPLFEALERERGLSSGSLSFAREFRGTGRKRAYLLNVAGKSPIWVVISKGKLVVVPEPSGKSTGSGSKHGGSGKGSGSGGNKPGGNGGNKPGGGTGGGSPKPGREEDPGEDKV